MGDNQITGSIPIEISKQINLTSPNLSGNQLIGSIPTEIGNLTALIDLRLYDNQLTGSIPPEIGNLIALTSLGLSTNQLTDIPDLSAITSLTVASIKNNQFDFGDLETANISSPDYSYAPQANIITNRIESGGNITLSVAVDGTNNSYHWFKDDVELTGETSNSITMVKTVEGIYYCKITDSNFPDLTLESEPVTIIPTFDISVSANPSEGGTVTGKGSYEDGHTATMIATPSEGYVFVSWTENGKEVSTNATFSFTVTGSRVLIANFDIATGIATVGENTSFQVYPNPAQKEVYLKFDDASINSKAGIKLRLVDETGRVIMLKVLSLETNKILTEIGDIKRGVYTLQLIADNKVKGNFRLIIID